MSLSHTLLFIYFLQERNLNTRTPDLPPEKSYAGQAATVKLDMEKQTGSKLGKGYIKAVSCHPAYLTYMQNIS